MNTKRDLAALICSIIAPFIMSGAEINPVELSLKSTNDYVFTSVKYTNLICGCGIGTDGKNRVMRFEDLAFLDEAFYERRKCAGFKFHTNNISRLDNGLSPVLPGVRSIIGILNDFYTYLDSSNYCAIVSTERSEGWDDRVRKKKNNELSQLFKPEYRDPFKGFQKFDMLRYITNIEVAASHKIPLVTRICDIGYGDIERCRFSVIEEKDMVTTNALELKVSNKLSYKRYTLDTHDGWIEKPYDGTNYYNYTYNDISSVEFLDSYLFEKNLYKDSHYGFGTVKGYYESVSSSSLTESTVTAFSDVEMVGEQRILSVSDALLVITATLNLSVDRYYDNFSTNILSGEYYVPVKNVSVDPNGRRIIVKFNPQEIKSALMTATGNRLPSSDGPRLADMISYVYDGEGYVTTTYVRSQLYLYVKKLVSLCEIQWNARVIENR